MRGGRGRLVALVALYVLLTFVGSWACWGAATAILSSDVRADSGLAPALSTLAGALKLMGTLVPPLVTYALFPRLRACGVAGAPTGGPDGARADARDGFWRFAFGGRPGAAGWAALAALAVWRWAMFRCAFGFPASPLDAVANFFVTFPVLLLGGGLEEIGWRGCLQPALARLVGGSRCGRVAGAVVAPLLTGCIWAAWHLPLFVMPGAFQNGIPFGPFMLVAIALSYSFGALRAVGRTLAFPILAHAWYNAMLVATPAFGPVALVLFSLEAVVGLVALALLARRATPAMPTPAPHDGL